MTLKKIANKGISLALTTVIIFGSLLNSVHATGINDEIKSNGYVLNDEGIYVNESLLLGYANKEKSVSNYNEFYENVERDFKNKFGEKDEYKLISSSKEFKTEGNGFTGQLRVTTYKNGSVDEVIFIDYLKNVKSYLEQLENDEKQAENYAESYVVKTIKSGGPDPLSFNVRTGGNYTSKYKMYATSWYGRNKTWYKNSDWNSGYTSGLYNELKSAKDNVNNIASSLSPGVSKTEVFAAIAGFLGDTTPIPGINTIAAALSAFAFVVPLISVAGYSLDYIKNINVAQYNFNNI